MRMRVRVLVSKLSEWVWAVSLLACSLKIRAAHVRHECTTVKTVERDEEEEDDS